ncbi:MAG: hypothetical protein ABIG96_03680 [Candidatus Micrarchaeota archaeon]
MADIASAFDSPDALSGAVSDVVRNFISAMSEFVPNFIAALLIFLVGYVIALVISRIFKRALEGSNFEKFLTQNKMADALGTFKVSNFLVKIVKYYIVLVFFQASISKLQLGTLTEFMSMLLIYAPVVVGAAIIFVVAALFGELVKAKVKELDMKSRWVGIVAKGAKFVVMFFGLVMGLQLVGVNTGILKETFITMVQALAYGVAIAVGIAFGFGGQDEAKSLINDVRKKINK